MKLLAEDLKRQMAIADIGVTEMVAEINKLQAEVGYTKRPMTRQTLYDYFHKISTPPYERMYIIAAILGIHPTKLFKLSVDDQKYKDYTVLYRNIK